MASKLSILIPVYNEWKTIGKLLQKLLVLEVEKEIIVVDDGSSDGTGRILEGYAKNPLIQIIRHASNKGKGSAIRTGLQYCSGDMVIIQDADLEQDPDDIYKLIEPMIKHGAKVVYGSRFLNQRPKMNGPTYLANIFLSRFTSLLFNTRITDLETCYKLFRVDVIKGLRLKARGFEFEPEVTAKLLKKGFLIHEVPIREDWYHGYNNNSKKVTWRDGVKAIFTLIKYRFTDD